MKKTAAVASAGGKHKGLNFEFLQKLGKALMVVIAVMPAAGLMISLGNIIRSSARMWPCWCVWAPSWPTSAGASSIT